MSFTKQWHAIDKKHIKNATKADLPELMRQDGFELEEYGGMGFLVSSRGQEYGMVLKQAGNSVWEWIDADVTRNAIQYVQYVHKLNFPDAVRFLDASTPALERPATRKSASGQANIST